MLEREAIKRCSASRLTATKPEIKAAVEGAVRREGHLGVNTLVMKGKTKRFKWSPRRPFRRQESLWCTLAEGQAIDLTTGLDLRQGQQRWH